MSLSEWFFFLFFFSSSHNWQQLPRLPWLHFSLLKLLASRTPLLFKDSCSHFKSFLAVRNQFWRGVRAWNGCGQCWKGNEIKPCLRLWERENPPEQWGLNECIKTVLIPLHHVCPQGTCSRSPEFYLRLIFNRSWQRCQRHEVKKKLFFLCCFSSKKATPGTCRFPSFAYFATVARCQVSLGLSKFCSGLFQGKGSPACTAHPSQGCRWFISEWLSDVDKLSCFTLLELELLKYNQN